MSFGAVAASYVDTASGGMTPPTHGGQVTHANVGYLAYYDSGLGRTITDADLTEISGLHYISDFVNDGGTLEKIYFSGDIRMDRNNVTFKGCKFADTFANYLNGDHASGTVLEYCTVSPGTVVDEAIRYQGYAARYCVFEGCTNGAKANGNDTTLEYCYIRVAGAAGDQTGGIQNVGGEGNVVVRGCNIDIAPTNGLGDPNACIQSGDMNAGAVLSMTIEDCLFSGGTAAYQLRLYDGGLSTGITFTVTGNKFVRGAEPLSRGAANATPLGQITWSNNSYNDNGEVISLA